MIYTHVYIYTHIHIYTYIYLYIYTHIYIYRERERDLLCYDMTRRVLAGGRVAWAGPKPYVCLCVVCIFVCFVDRFNLVLFVYAKYFNYGLAGSSRPHEWASAHESGRARARRAWEWVGGARLHRSSGSGKGSRRAAALGAGMRVGWCRVLLWSRGTEMSGGGRITNQISTHNIKIN